MDQATRSEKRAASLELHSFRQTNATAMDSLGTPQQIRKQRLGHSGNSMTESYTHTFTQDERVAAEKLGEPFGTPKSFPNARMACRAEPASHCESISLVAGACDLSGCAAYQSRHDIETWA